MIFNQFQRLLKQVIDATNNTGLSDRMGTVEEVMQKGGEQKIRAVIGLDPDGKPLLSPWINPTAHHSGASTEQHQYKKGQNVRLSAPNANYRMATVTHAPEAKHAPQPKNAPQHGYGNSYQVGGKLFGGYWSPDESQQGGQGGGGNGGQGAGGGEEKHRHETWIAKKDQKPPKYAGKSQVMSGNGQGGSQQGQQGQQAQQEKLEEDVMVSADEKHGWTARVKKDKVRLAAHEKGGMMEAGKTFFAAHMDKDAVMASQGDSFITSQKKVWVKGETNYVNTPWRIASNSGKNNIPKDDQLGNGGTKGGHSSQSSQVA